MHREIDQGLARQVLRILVWECGYRIPDPRDADAFVQTIATTSKPERMLCREYRFCGALGYGGKFRNNGNRENVPHVDCYPEDETPARRQMIEAANAQLRELFSESTALASAEREGK